MIDWLMKNCRRDEVKDAAEAYDDEDEQFEKMKVAIGKSVDVITIKKMWETSNSAYLERLLHKF